MRTNIRELKWKSDHTDKIRLVPDSGNHIGVLLSVLKSFDVIGRMAIKISAKDGTRRKEEIGWLKIDRATDNMQTLIIYPINGNRYFLSLSELDKVQIYAII